LAEIRIGGFSPTAGRHDVVLPAMLALYGAPEVAARLDPASRPPTAEEVRAQLDAGPAHWRARSSGRFLLARARHRRSWASASIASARRA
jgi:hypothetical protein